MCIFTFSFFIHLIRYKRVEKSTFTLSKRLLLRITSHIYNLDYFSYTINNQYIIIKIQFGENFGRFVHWFGKPRGRY